jgi:hypothetical protein
MTVGVMGGGLDIPGVGGNRLPGPMELPRHRRRSIRERVVGPSFELRDDPSERPEAQALDRPRLEPRDRRLRQADQPAELLLGESRAAAPGPDAAANDRHPERKRGIAVIGRRPGSHAQILTPAACPPVIRAFAANHRVLIASWAAGASAPRRAPNRRHTVLEPPLVITPTVIGRDNGQGIGPIPVISAGASARRSRATPRCRA